MNGAKILLLGAEYYALEAVSRLISAGAVAVTIVDDKTVSEQTKAANVFLANAEIGSPAASAAIAALSSKHGVEGTATLADPAEWCKTSAGTTAQFDITIVANLPRAVEVAMGDVTWDARKTLVISRSERFNVKWRSQFQQYTATDTSPPLVIKGKNLDGAPEPMTPEQAETFASIVKSLFPLPEYAAYFVSLSAAERFNGRVGYWPGQGLTTSSDDVAALERDAECVRADAGVNVDAAAVTAILETIVQKGISTLPLTSNILATLMSREATVLVSTHGIPVGSGQPVHVAKAALGL